MLACKEVSRAIAADELETAGWRRRLAIRLHLLMCRYCRRYSRQIRTIGTAAREMLGGQAPDPASKDRLRSSILGRFPRERRGG